MWRILKTLRSIGSRFRSLNPNQPTATTCDDCNTTSSNFADRSVVPIYPFTANYKTNSEGKKGTKDNCKSKKTCHNQPPPTDASVCSILEALGWSTAALFGVQQFVALRRQRQAEPEDIKPKSSCTASCFLSRYVYSTARVPIHNQSWILSILPQNTRSSKIPQLEQPISPSHELSNLAPSHDLSYLSSLPSELPTNSSGVSNSAPNVLPEKTEVDSAVTAAALELQAVTNLCVATIQNNVGIQLSQKNKPVEALPYFLAGCELGFTKACFNAAVCYEMGLGTKKDLEKAKELYEVAAEKGHVTAMYNLGVFYKEGIGNTAKDLHKSIELFEKAAAAGLKEAQRALGLHYIQCSEVDKAFPFLEAASQQKDPDAQYYLGVCYENGWGIDENMAKAADLYSKAAQKGHLDATYNLAVFYELGLGGLPQQLDTALDMYKTVADTGHVEATIRAKYVAEQIGADCRCHDAELLTDPELIQLHSSASAPELHMSTPAQQFSNAQLSKSSSANVLSLANVFNPFSQYEGGLNQSEVGHFQDTCGHQNEMAQTHSLEVPWVAV